VPDRWDELDSTPITWHINPEFSEMENPFITEPWQLAVNGIY